MIQFFMAPIVLLLLVVLAYILWKGEREQRWDSDEEMVSRRKCKAELAEIRAKRPEMICDHLRAQIEEEHDAR